MHVMTLLMAGWLLGAAPPPQKGPEPLPDDVVKAWKKAGAEVGWMGRHRRYARTAVPAFSVRDWRGGVLAKLPAPATPFGLSFSGTVTDVGMKELAALKNLTWLYLDRTKVKAKGLEELRKALPRCKVIPPGRRPIAPPPGKQP